MKYKDPSDVKSDISSSKEIFDRIHFIIIYEKKYFYIKPL